MRNLYQTTCFLMLLSILFLIGCGSQNQPTYQTISEAQFEPGSAIPAPTEDVVLTLVGNITITNVDDTLALDLPTLEKLGLVEYTVDDPWLQEEVTYSGVLVSELLKFAGVDSDATISVVALDGYSADIPASEIEAWPVLLATQANNQHLSIENNGPTRIIFPYDSHSDVAAARNMSVWNVESIVVQ